MNESTRLNGDWLAAVNLSRCGRAACAVAGAIYARFNHQDGYAEPSVATIADDTLLSERSVQVGIRELENEGLIAVERPDTNGRGRASKYRPIMVQKKMKRAAPITYEKVQNPAPIDDGEKVQNGVKIGAESCAEKVQNPAPKLLEENFKKELLSNAGADATTDQDIFAATPAEVAKAMAHPTPPPVALSVSWLDWRQAHPRVAIARAGEDGDTDAWRHLWDTYGPDCFTPMYNRLIRDLPAGKRIWYSQAAEWLAANCQEVPA
jgi:hypothetical protein